MSDLRKLYDDARRPAALLHYTRQGRLMVTNPKGYVVDAYAAGELVELEEAEAAYGSLVPESAYSSRTPVPDTCPTCGSDKREVRKHRHVDFNFWHPAEEHGLVEATDCIDSWHDTPVPEGEVAEQKELAAIVAFVEKKLGTWHAGLLTRALSRPLEGEVAEMERRRVLTTQRLAEFLVRAEAGTTLGYITGARQALAELSEIAAHALNYKGE
jgi:hypothetical protein